MYRALIVCNSRFGSDAALSELHGPKVDGTLLRDALTDHDSGMFDRADVRFVPEAKSRDISEAIEEFYQAAEPDDTLLFYYSGHGLIRNQQLFLCAEDTDTRKPVSTAVSEATINSIVANSFAQVKIIILDCCHSGMLKDGSIIESLSGTGRYIIAATSAAERATDANARGLASPFTRTLIDGLTGKAADRDDDGYVALDDIYDYLEQTRFEGPRPQRKFDGQGAVSIARRTAPGASASRDDLAELPPAARGAQLPVLSYMDTLAPGAAFAPAEVSQFRAGLRGQLTESLPASLTDREFLEHLGVMRNDALTYAGVLLFGRNPGALFPTAVIQCTRFHGTAKTAPLNTVEYSGTVADVIIQARDFVATNARLGETATAQSAYAETTYRYPMVAVREIIANAVVHRDYEDHISCVQIHLFDDRLEIINPGRLTGTPALPEGKVPLSQLKRQSQRRNFRLARILGLSKLVEGVGAGIPRAIADSQTARAEEPVVIIDDRSVTVQIFPGTPEEPPGLSAENDPSQAQGRRSPMYRQIADDLRAQIQSGALAPDAKLPTEAELTDRYQASRNTVRDAIRRLTDEGLLVTRHGKGTFVARAVDPFVTVLNADPKTGFGGGETAAYLSEVSGRHREPTSSVPQVEISLASQSIAELLQIPRETQVVIRSQSRYIDGIPWSRQTSFYLLDFITRGATELLMARDIEGGVLRYLADELGVRQTGYQDWITARPADEEEQVFFGVGHEAAVFEIFRTAFDQDSKPIRVTVTVSPADRNQLIVNSGTDGPAPVPGPPGHA